MRGLILLTGLLVVLAACTAQAPANNVQQAEDVVTTYACPDGTIVTDVAECPTPTQEEIEQDEELLIDDSVGEGVQKEDGYFADTDDTVFNELFRTDEEATASVDPELTKIIERAADKTKNGYNYVYLEIEDELPGGGIYKAARIFIKGDERAIHFDKEVDVEDAEADRLVGNVNDEEVTAYCRGCKEEVDPFMVPVSYIQVKEPIEWLNELQDAQIKPARSFNGRSTLLIEGTVNGETIEVYVDEFSGVPIRVQVDEENRFEYDLALGASDSAFEAP